MAVKKLVHFFLEDNAQERIVPPLFQRILIDAGKTREEFRIEVLHSRGGGSIKALKCYIEDAKRRGSASSDCVVIGSDANCKGYAKKREILIEEAKGLPFFVITAIPDPHIERWYLLDANAISIAVGEKILPHPPEYKCGKDEYKRALRNVFKNSQVEPLSGGVEYGPEIAANLHLYKCGKQDAGLADFIKQVRDWGKTF